MKHVDRELLDLAESVDLPEVDLIVGAPRTGATLAYLLLCREGRAFIPNFVNDEFAESPRVGAALACTLPVPEISLRPRYGRVVGRAQPSEGNALWRRWFGEAPEGQGDPIEFREGMAHEFQTTLRVFAALRPGVRVALKSAWACFRLPALRRALDYRLRVVHVVRGPEAACASALLARYVTRGGDYWAWTGPKPPNYPELRLLSPERQVAESWRAHVMAAMTNPAVSYEELAHVDPHRRERALTDLLGHAPQHEFIPDLAASSDLPAADRKRLEAIFS